MIDDMKAVGTIEQVVNGGYCVGCGACADAVKGRMVVNRFGEYVPDQNAKELQSSELARKICPSLNPEADEDFLASRFVHASGEKDESIGFYHSIFAGYVREGSFRANGTSGGMGTWIGVELLRQGLIDGVIHVKQSRNTEGSGKLFEYGLSITSKEIIDGAKTKYHVVELSRILQQIREREGRYLFIGVPCMCKAMRRIQLQDQVIKDRVAFVASLVCGHLKSMHLTTSLAWAKSVEPGQIEKFQYRTKGDGIAARSYVYRVSPKDHALPVIQQDAAGVVGGKYNAGALMLNACDFCDDVVGETADLTIGDAWIPRFEVDDSGTNLLISRNPTISTLLQNAAQENRVQLSPISAYDAAESQSGGFRHRREGLSYRLSQKIKSGVAVPVKRVSPTQFRVNRLRRKVYDQRSRVSRLSRIAFREALDANDYDVYRMQMVGPLKKLRSLELRSIFFRAMKNRLARILRRVALRFSKVNEVN